MTQSSSINMAAGDVDRAGWVGASSPLHRFLGEPQDPAWRRRRRCFPWGRGSQGASVMLPHTRRGQPEFSAVLIITNSLWEANSK